MIRIKNPSVDLNSLIGKKVNLYIRYKDYKFIGSGKLHKSKRKNFDFEIDFRPTDDIEKFWFDDSQIVMINGNNVYHKELGKPLQWQYLDNKEQAANVKNPSNLLKEEIKILEKKLEKVQEAIEYYSKELRILKKHGNEFQINKTNSKLKLLYGDLANLLELLS